MGKIDSERKRDEHTINDSAEIIKTGKEYK